MRRFEFDPEPQEDHAYCRAYGHQWRKSDILSARERPNVTIEACSRCGETRRVANVKR